MKNVKFILGIIAVFMMVASSSLAQVVEHTQYAKLVYMGKKCDLDQKFFIGYKSIYDTNISKFYKKQKERADWDKINNEITSYLTNPNITVVYDEMGNISFAGGYIRLDGNYTDKKLSKQDKKDNEKAAKLYGNILNTAIREWYKKYQTN